MIEQIFIAVSVLMLPFAIYIKLWRRSVSTMLFIAACCWISINLHRYDSGEHWEWGVVLGILVAAFLRAVLKRDNDTIFPRHGASI